MEVGEGIDTPIAIAFSFFFLPEKTKKKNDLRYILDDEILTLYENLEVPC